MDEEEKRRGDGLMRFRVGSARRSLRERNEWFEKEEHGLGNERRKRHSADSKAETHLARTVSRINVHKLVHSSQRRDRGQWHAVEQLVIGSWLFGVRSGGRPVRIVRALAEVEGRGAVGKRLCAVAGFLGSMVRVRPRHPTTWGGCDKTRGPVWKKERLARARDRVGEQGGRGARGDGGGQKQERQPRAQTLTVGRVRVFWAVVDVRRRQAMSGTPFSGFPGEGGDGNVKGNSEGGKVSWVERRGRGATS